MREIIFRGKRIDNGEWAKGCYYESNISGCYILTPKLKVRKTDGIVIGNKFEVYDVIPETIGQYTGLEDKKEQKIFEGDILRTDLYRGENAEIVFEEGCFMTQTRYTTDVLYDIYYLSCEEGYILFEVIGNIHDNPELLKESEEK